MPIPFHDADDHLGTAAYLHVEPTPEGYAGALFQITARGEPVEFTWNRVTAPPSILWRPGDLRRAALRLLATTLFETSPIEPTLLVVRSEAVPPDLFTADLHVHVPILQVSVTPDGEIRPTWLVAGHVGTPAEQLAETLATHGLLLEPFERAGEGLKEANEDGPHPPTPAPDRRARG